MLQMVDRKSSRGLLTCVFRIVFHCWITCSSTKLKNTRRSPAVLSHRPDQLTNLGVNPGTTRMASP